MRRRTPPSWLAPALAVAWSCGDRPGPTASLVRETHLANRLETARAAGPPGQELSAPAVEIGGESRRALSYHPPSTISFPGVPVAADSVLSLAPALHPDAGDGSDGVRFRVSCEAPEGEARLLATSRSPDAGPGWEDETLTLDGCTRPFTTIRLETDCGPSGDCAHDRAIWGAPVVRTRIEASAPPRLVLLVSIDTLRRDRLGLYGGPRPTSPHLDGLGAQGLVFDHSVSVAPWTIPAHASMMTSTRPRVHRGDHDHAFSGELPTLAGTFTAHGWATAGFADAPYLSSRYGFDRGFEHYDDRPAFEGDFRRGADQVLELLLEWLLGVGNRSAFVFWHLMDVHGPYGAASPAAGRFRPSAPSDPESLEPIAALGYHDHLEPHRFGSLDDLVAAYDEGVSLADHTLGKLFDALRALGLWDDAIVLVTSDHGERFLDDGVMFGHGLFLGSPDLDVPFVLKLRGNRLAGRRSDRLVSSLDVAPTLLHEAGLPVPEGFSGSCAVPHRGSTSPRLVVGYSDNVDAGFVRSQRFHFVEPSRRPPDEILAHLAPRAGKSPPVAPLLAGGLSEVSSGGDLRLVPLDGDATGFVVQAREILARARRTPGVPPVAAVELDRRDLDRLRALGYVR